DLYQVRHRTYRSILGAWLERDFVEYDDGFNLYEYVHGRPITFLDVYGTISSGGPGRPAPLPAIIRPGPTLWCNIAIRCYTVRRSGAPLGRHCGLIVCDNWSCEEFDGSGGNTNTWEVR